MGYDRLLVVSGPGAIDYEIVSATGEIALSFTTDSVNGKTPDDTAIGNLLDYSEYHDGIFAIRRSDEKVFCFAEGGLGWGMEDEPTYPAKCPACKGTGGGQYNDCAFCGGNGVV